MATDYFTAGYLLCSQVRFSVYDYVSENLCSFLGTISINKTAWLDNRQMSMLHLMMCDIVRFHSKCK